MPLFRAEKTRRTKTQAQQTRAKTKTSKHSHREAHSSTPSRETRSSVTRTHQTVFNTKNRQAFSKKRDEFFSSNNRNICRTMCKLPPPSPAPASRATEPTDAPPKRRRTTQKPVRQPSRRCHRPSRPERPRRPTTHARPPPLHHPQRSRRIWNADLRGQLGDHRARSATLSLRALSRRRPPGTPASGRTQCRPRAAPHFGRDS